MIDDLEVNSEGGYNWEDSGVWLDQAAVPGAGRSTEMNYNEANFVN